MVFNYYSLPLYFFSLLSDITDRKEAEEELKTPATTDMLTGLWNRRYFMQALEKELQRARRHGHDLSLIMLDVDHFKAINDSFGHQAGDCTLRQIGCLFLNRLRVADTVARLSGDEIAIILPETKVDHACERAGRSFIGGRPGSLPGQGRRPQPGDGIDS